MTPACDTKSTHGAVGALAFVPLARSIRLGRHPRLLCHALGPVDLLSNVLSASLRGTQDVQPQPILGAVFLPVYVCLPGLVVSGTARLRDLAPRAPRV